MVHYIHVIFFRPNLAVHVNFLNLEDFFDEGRADFLEHFTRSSKNEVD